MRRRRWGRGAAACAAAVMVVAFAVGGRADAAGGPGEVGSDSSGTAQVPAQVGSPPVAVTAAAQAGPIAVLGISDEALTCIQSPLALDGAGRAGVLAPQVGAIVIRGSAAPSPSVTWVVVPVGRSDGDGTGAVTVCAPTR